MPQRPIGTLRIEFICAIEIRHGIGKGIVVQVGDAAIKMGSAVVGLEPDRLAEIRDGAAVLAFEMMDETPSHMGKGVLGASRIASVKSAIARSVSPLTPYALPRPMKANAFSGNSRIASP